MPLFVNEFEALIVRLFTNRARFADATGASTAYLSEIFNKGKLPTVEKLQEWLEKGGVSPSEAQRLILLCSKEKAAEVPDLKPWMDHLDAQHVEVKKLLESLVDLCAKGGLKVPQDLQERVRAL